MVGEEVHITYLCTSTPYSKQYHWHKIKKINTNTTNDYHQQEAFHWHKI